MRNQLFNTIKLCFSLSHFEINWRNASYCSMITISIIIPIDGASAWSPTSSKWHHRTKLEIRIWQRNENRFRWERKRIAANVALMPYIHKLSLRFNCSVFAMRMKRRSVSIYFFHFLSSHSFLYQTPIRVLSRQICAFISNSRIFTILLTFTHIVARNSYCTRKVCSQKPVSFPTCHNTCYPAQSHWLTRKSIAVFALTFGLVFGLWVHNSRQSIGVVTM